MKLLHAWSLAAVASLIGDQQNQLVYFDKKCYAWPCSDIEIFMNVSLLKIRDSFSPISLSPLLNGERVAAEIDPTCLKRKPSMEIHKRSFLTIFRQTT